MALRSDLEGTALPGATAAGICLNVHFQRQILHVRMSSFAYLCKVGEENLVTGRCEKILHTTLLRSWLGNSSLLRKNLQSRECERAVVRPNFSHVPDGT